jgi:hypothetical protein
MNAWQNKELIRAAATVVTVASGGLVRLVEPGGHVLVA